METTKELRLAVLIDAGNVSYSNVKEMIEEIAKYCTTHLKEFMPIRLNQRFQVDERKSKKK